MRVLGLAPIPREPELAEGLIEGAAVHFFGVRQCAVDIEYQRLEVTRRFLRLALRALRYAVPAARKPWVAFHGHPCDACVAPACAAFNSASCRVSHSNTRLARRSSPSMVMRASRSSSGPFCANKRLA